jgi:DNA repair protein RecN (Recombination protein N)
MLVELTIRDFAIIDLLSVSWSAGLNVLTGETGAGKSIIVDAVGALLGDRLGAEAVRAGQERAVVEGIFELDLSSASTRTLRELLESHDLFDDDRQLILRRELSRGGRSVARLNGRAVPLNLLQQVGEQLVDVHGQSQHLSLLRVREHLELLDRFAGLIEQRRTLGALVERWRGVQTERRKLQEEIRAAARERDLLRHEVADIESVDPRPGEEEELTNQRQRLRNAVRLREAAEQALLALSGLDDQRGAADLLGEAALRCAEAGRADSTLADQADSLERLAADAEDIARALRDYLDGFDSDPRQIEDIEARYLALADLKRKYGDTVEAVLSYLALARSRLATAEQGESLLADLDAREAALRVQLTEQARQLSLARSAAVERLSAEIEQELHDLNLTAARFGVSVEQQADPAGLDWDGSPDRPRRVAVDATGADRVEFLLSANRGEPLRSLNRIASGGELARVSLALKAVLARVDPRATLIFDEVDVGVGGRSASVVGQKLWSLTRTHQVLCITHMPQVAAYADHHLVVGKQLDADRTKTAVAIVEGPDIVAELAAMLGGSPDSPAVSATAEELLRRSADWKAVPRLGGIDKPNTVSSRS